MASRRPAVRLLSRGDAVVVTLAASLDSVATVHPSHETEIYARLANMIKVLVNERYCVTTDLPIIPYYVKLIPSRIASDAGLSPPRLAGSTAAEQPPDQEFSEVD